MSENFVQFIFPCKDCLVRAACKENPDNEAIKHLYKDNRHRCLAVPKLPPNVSYHKGLLECMANLGAELINAVEKTEDPQTKTEKTLQAPDGCDRTNPQSNRVGWTNRTI